MTDPMAMGEPEPSRGTQREGATAPDEALEAFTGLRERLKSGLRRIMEIDRKHPHYVAAVVIAIGCEAVGRLLSAIDGRGRAPHEVFVNDLILPYRTLDAFMGRDLFDAARNGIAHRFETKPIELKGGQQIEVIVNWGERLPHLGLCTSPRGIYLNLFQMQRDFEAMLDRYRDELLRTTRPGRRPADAWYQDWRAVTYTQDDSNEGWQTFLTRTEAEPGR